MSATLPPMVNKQSLLVIKSKGRVVIGIEQMRCRAVRFTRGMENSLQNAATPLQYVSAWGIPPTTINIKH